MPAKTPLQNVVVPVLRLRPPVLTEQINPRQIVKQPDGPWIAHPDLILDSASFTPEAAQFAPDITLAEYRKWHKDGRQSLAGAAREDFEILSVITVAPSVKMQQVEGMTDDQIASALERYYVGAHQYLQPRLVAPPSMVQYFGADWALNARGIYYRHYYSSGWVTADHGLWLPSLDVSEWDQPSEEPRRARARRFLRHTLDNEKWNKSEYSWDADAFSDVFGQMRDDPALAVDKHDYNTIGTKTHEVSCLLTGESKLIFRKPDATFGLATFRPRDYQNAIAEWDLDRDRLEALLLHRHCGLLSDPRWGEADLVFPFAVFEAKGWSGDARVARRQACTAGAVYLDMLDRLAREPGKMGRLGGAYQTERSRSNQVFVFTSFGAHWHILVGYKRPRLKREHAGRDGWSKSVYVFQRIWSARVATEQKAWELLSMVDQIHMWGATDFRDFVIQHLKPWHEFCGKCFDSDVDFSRRVAKPGGIDANGLTIYKFPETLLQPADWTKHFPEETRKRLELRVCFHLREAMINYPIADHVRAKGGGYVPFLGCGLGHCGNGLEDGGYPLDSLEDVLIHMREIHGESDDVLAELAQNWEYAGDSSHGVPIRLPFRDTGTIINGPRRTRKRSYEDALDSAGVTMFSKHRKQN